MSHKRDFDNASLKQQGGDLLLVADYKIGQGFHVLGKGGLAVLRQTDRAEYIDFLNPYSYSRLTVEGKKTMVTPEIAGGIAYDFTENFSVNATVSHNFTIKNKLAGGTNALIGLKVSF